jgi:hypothetical protein
MFPTSLLTDILLSKSLISFPTVTRSFLRSSMPRLATISSDLCILAPGNHLMLPSWPVFLDLLESKLVLCKDGSLCKSSISAREMYSPFTIMGGSFSPSFAWPVL